MTPSSPRRICSALAALLTAGVLISCLAGCAQKEKTPPASAGYYTGPMKKNGGGGTPGRATPSTTTPANTPGGGI